MIIIIIIISGLNLKNNEKNIDWFCFDGYLSMNGCAELLILKYFLSSQHFSLEKKKKRKIIAFIRLIFFNKLNRFFVINYLFNNIWLAKYLSGVFNNLGKISGRKLFSLIFFFFNFSPSLKSHLNFPANLNV